VAVAGVRTDVAELDQGVERPPQRLAPDVEPPLELDEPCAPALAEQCEGRRSPTVMKELDQIFG